MGRFYHAACRGDVTFAHNGRVSHTTTYGGLTCRVVGASDPDLVVVFCHGFGAPGDDLVPLGGEVLRALPALADRVRIVFPEAPLSLRDAGYGTGRAWWMFDPMRLYEARGPDDIAQMLRAECPDGLPRARRLLTAAVSEIARQGSLPLGRILLGGFSQGAMVSTDVALRLEEAPAALAVLSGTYVCEREWAARAKGRAGLSVLQSHGRSDPLLPFVNAEALRDLFTSAGLQVDWLPFEGGHTVPLAALGRLAHLVERALAAP